MFSKKKNNTLDIFFVLEILTSFFLMESVKTIRSTDS